jgi:orotidine-5'-phosphate decarboxylase
MVRYGDQEQSSPGGTIPRTSQEAARREGAGAPDGPEGAQVRQAGQEDPHRVPHPRQAPLRRTSLLRRSETLRAIPSLARFLNPASPDPGDTRISQDPPLQPAEGGQDPDRQAAADGQQEARQDAQAGQDASTGNDTLNDTLAGWNAGFYWETESDQGDSTDGSRGAQPRRDAPESSAAELRELAELADLLTELAGLVHDLGALIIGLMTAAAGAGERQVRTLKIPPALAELAAAHHELKTEQQALDARFAAVRGQRERAALRGSLAALTERATKAVSAAAAAVIPPEGQTSGRPSGEATLTGEAGPQLSEPLREPLREETGVQSTTGGSPSQGPVRWSDASVADRRLAPVAVALDAPNIDVAAHWATLVTPYVSTVKIGLELYLRYGPTVVATVRGGSGVHVFLDLKLHDIPNTVAGAARAVSKLRPEILTVHAAGGADMIKAAVECAPDTIVAGVTLLTSIGDKDLVELGIDGSVSDAVRRMAELAVAAGARGLVCSPQEVAAVRAEVGQDILLITPGIRPAGATSDDQARVATPEEALKAGADLLVIGRPITKSPDPGAAAAAIAGSLRRAFTAS